MNRPPLSIRNLALLASLALPLACATAHAEDARFPNSEDLRHIKAIGSPALSPDGRQVLFTLTDATADGAKSHVWLVLVSGGAARQLTYSPTTDKRGEHNAAWAPDGSAIFFLAKRGENTQVFRLPLAGGEASPYDLKVVSVVDDSKEKGAIPPAKPDAAETVKADAKPEALPINPSGFALSPDGHWLTVWAADPETPGEKKAKEAKADAVWVNHQRHGERIYLAALKADGSIDGALKPVGIAPDVHSVSWSPMSDRLIVVTDLPNQASDLGPALTAWLVTVSGLDKPLALKGVPATVRGNFSWNLEGTEVVFAAQTPEDAPPGVEELFALALPAGDSAQQAEARRLMPGFSGGLGSGEPVFLPEGKLLVPVVEGTKIAALRLSLDGKAASAPI